MDERVATLQLVPFFAMDDKCANSDRSDRKATQLLSATTNCCIADSPAAKCCPWTLFSLQWWAQQKPDIIHKEGNDSIVAKGIDHILCMENHKARVMVQNRGPLEDMQIVVGLSAASVAHPAVVHVQDQVDWLPVGIFFEECRAKFCPRRLRRKVASGASTRSVFRDCQRSVRRAVSGFDVEVSDSKIRNAPDCT
eukprot:279361-Pleurochrysis_carterae.AAC.1